MSKLLIAFVHADDAVPVAEALRDDGHRFTRLASRGGFLDSDNATFFIAVEDEEEARALAVFEQVSQGREVELPLVLLERLVDWKARTVTHGGATILVVDLARIVRV